MIYFTADLHLGSTNIIEYCNRPFKDAKHMIIRLTKEINQKCKPSDVLVSVGDYCLYGKERGVESLRIKPIEFDKIIKCQLIHLTGNHDLNNGLKSFIKGAYMKVGKKTAWVQHYPPWYDGYKAPTDADIYICGHVHRDWKFRTYKGKLCINVGIDVNQMRPVSVQQIVQWLDKFKPGKLNVN